MEVEVAVVLPQARVLATPRSWKRHEGPSPAAVRGSLALPTPWSWTSSSQTCDRIHFCCLKPPSAWDFVIAPSLLTHGNLGQTAV